MSPHIVTREEWRAEREEFLLKEKELTRARDALNRQRRELPMTVVDQEYVFEGPRGGVTLLDLFEGRRQLIVYHFMPLLEGYGWCPICSFWVDNLGRAEHLHARDTSLVVICPAPLSESEPFRKRMGWTVPWYSCQDNDFYEDFHLEAPGGSGHCEGEGEGQAPGVSAFLRDGDRVLYGYSTHARGSDLLNGTYNYLDLTPLGRQEEGLEDTMGWVRYHDEYGL